MNTPQPAIVRTALDAALVSGDPRPELDFGHIYVRMTMSGYWVVIAPRLVETHCKTTEQAVAAIAGPLARSTFITSRRFLEWAQTQTTKRA